MFEDIFDWFILGGGTIHRFINSFLLLHLCWQPNEEFARDSFFVSTTLLGVSLTNDTARFPENRGSSAIILILYFDLKNLIIFKPNQHLNAVPTVAYKSNIFFRKTKMHFFFFCFVNYSKVSDCELNLNLLYLFLANTWFQYFFLFPFPFFPTPPTFKWIDSTIRDEMSFYHLHKKALEELWS